MTKLIAVTSMLGILGCAAMRVGEVSDNLKQMVGHNIQEIIDQWGPPTQQSQQGENATYSWTWGGNSVSAIQPGTMFTNPYVVTTERSCRKWFTADRRGKIVSWGFYGYC